MFARVLLLFLVLLAGCSPFYVIRAAYEEGKILWKREPIEELLKNPDLDTQTREKFELVLAIRVYARDELKLRVKGSYAAYSHLDRPVLSYVLIAAPQTSLEPYTWWFPIVGRVPYKGFFSQAKAESKATGFQQRGYDTTIRPVSAFQHPGLVRRSPFGSSPTVRQGHPSRSGFPRALTQHFVCSGVSEFQ